MLLMQISEIFSAARQRMIGQNHAKNETRNYFEEMDIVEK
jgi:hypothetical protein